MNPDEAIAAPDAGVYDPSPTGLFRGIARPVSPHPIFPVVELPEDRSDFSRDDAATGV